MCCCFLTVVPIYKSLSSTLKKPEAYIFAKIYDFFLNLSYFDHEDIDLGSPKLQAIEIFNQTTSIDMWWF